MFTLFSSKGEPYKYLKSFEIVSLISGVTSSRLVWLRTFTCSASVSISFLPCGNFITSVDESPTRAAAPHRYSAGMLRFFHFLLDLCAMTTSASCQFRSWMTDTHSPGGESCQVAMWEQMSNACSDGYAPCVLNDHVNQKVQGQEWDFFGMVLLCPNSERILFVMSQHNHVHSLGSEIYFWHKHLTARHSGSVNVALKKRLV